MQVIKIRIIPALLAFFTITVGLSIGGCTTTYLDMKSWEGRTVHDLYFEMGKPDEIDSEGGNTVYIWISERTVDGQVKTCTRKFYAKNYGHGEVIVDTRYSGCLFLTVK